MITMEKLKELRKMITPGTSIEAVKPYPIFIEMADTIEALWKVAEAANALDIEDGHVVINGLENLQDALAALKNENSGGKEG